MTFEEFQATGRDHADLGLFSANALDQGLSGPGRSYGADDDLFIEGTPGKYCLTLANTSVMEPAVSLARMERMLYDWAIDEGYVS